MEEIKLIKDIKDIVTKQDADTLSNKLMNAQVELNRTRNFLSDASNFCTDDYDIGLSCKMILRKHIEYLQYKIEMLEKMHTNTPTKRKAPKPTKQVSKPDVANDNGIDMLLL